MDSFDKSIFINCPFDEDYLKLLHPMLFTILYLGYNPRIALERSNSAETRFSKIVELIGNCKYSIHDLSRCQAAKQGEYYRLNMPFELGLDIGAREFNKEKFHGKICLILEEKKFRYQTSLSDISNSDIKIHEGKALGIVEAIRNWVAENSTSRIPIYSLIWRMYLDFTSDFYKMYKNEGIKIGQIYEFPIPEIIREMREWISKIR